MDIIIIGLLLGGTYALMAMGLQLQYGVARIMNLASGETLVCGAFAAVCLFTAYKLGPLLALVGIVPLATGLMGWCPAYTLFGMNTCGTKK